MFEDYRNLRGRFDKIVSIEMFEAACYRLLEPHGGRLVQTITINYQKFPAYRRRSDWIQKHIFPGSEPASLGLFHAEDLERHISDVQLPAHQSRESARPRGGTGRVAGGGPLNGDSHSPPRTTHPAAAR